MNLEKVYLLKSKNEYCITGNWRERNHLRAQNKKLISNKIFTNGKIKSFTFCSCEMKSSARKNSRMASKTLKS